MFYTLFFCPLTSQFKDFLKSSIWKTITQSMCAFSYTLIIDTVCSWLFYPTRFFFFFFFFDWIIPQVISAWWKWNIYGNQKRNSRINISLILLPWIIPQVISVSSTQITPYVLLLNWWLSDRILVQVYSPSQNSLVFSLTETVQT